MGNYICILSLINNHNLIYVLFPVKYIPHIFGIQENLKTTGLNIKVCVTVSLYLSCYRRDEDISLNKMVEK